MDRIVGIYRPKVKQDTDNFTAVSAQMLGLKTFSDTLRIQRLFLHL